VIVTLSRTPENAVTIVVQDTGGRFPETLDFQHAESLGLQLVCSLTEQLRGTIALDRHESTTFTVTFPMAPAAQNGQTPYARTDTHRRR
jgi:two-component sensor histidine kinase